MVLVTRPEPGASETAARLLDLGYSPVQAPCLEVVARAAHLPSPAGLAAVLATSGQAVALPAAYHGVPLFAVGDATARRASAAGFATVHSADGDAADLRRLILRECDPAAGALLLAVGAGQSQSLATDLRQDGFRVLRRVVYAVRPVSRLADAVAAALHRQEVRAALFFSAETAQAFVRLLPGELRGALAEVDALAIGRKAGAALRVLPWHDVRVALRPTQDELLALL